MNLDNRLPLGLMLAIMGLILGYGLVSNPAEYQRSRGININLWRGTVLLVLGASCFSSPAAPRRSTDERPRVARAEAPTGSRGPRLRVRRPART